MNDHYTWSSMYIYHQKSNEVAVVDIHMYMYISDILLQNKLGLRMQLQERQ